MVPDRWLLILSCSQRKRPDAGLLLAIERYDGPTFRVLRKFLRERPSEAQSLDFYILSSEFGLIPSSQPIPNYDRRMTSRRAVELQPHVLKEFKNIVKDNQYAKLLISLGKDYLRALIGYELLLPANLSVTISTGSQGRKQAELHDWLYGVPPMSPCTPPITTQPNNVRIRGVEITLTAEQALEIARQALAEGRGDPNRYHSWYVQMDDRRVAPKWLVSQLAGLPVSAFVTDEARRVLAQLGIEVFRA